MTGSREDLLLKNRLLTSQASQPIADQQYDMYPTSSACMVQQLEKQDGGTMQHSFCQSVHHPFLADFGDVQQGMTECSDTQRFQEVGGHIMVGGPMSGGNAVEDRLSARRLHKADREKLRRDKLNEQFSELASALDPDRPKNDKATILGESVQIVKDLREEVKRLKTEHTSLLNESRDLTQEKNELREEKATLKNETEQLQTQLQQRLRTSSPWMTMDPSMVMGAAAFPYPVPVPQPVSLSQSDSHQVGPPRALVTPTPYMPLAPPMGTFHMHPGLQAYAMFGNRPGDAANSYIPFPAFPQPVNSHIERPYAQYPSPVQPVPGYVVQMPPTQGSQAQVSPPPSSSPVYRPCVPGIPVVPAPNHASSQRSKGGSHRSLTCNSTSQQTPTESEQESGTAVASECHVEGPGSPVIQPPDTCEETGSPEIKDANSGMGQGNSSGASPAVGSPSCTNDKLELPSSQCGLSLINEGNKLSGSQPSTFSGIEAEAEDIHDPTLRPPAA